MRAISLLLVLAISLSLSLTAARTDESAAKIDIDKVMAALAAYADHFERALPDFIAEERLTQEFFNNGKAHESTVTVSRLTGRQLRIKEAGRTRRSFTESREILTINGKKSAGTKLNSHGAQVGGVFSSILLAHFSARDQADYYFDLQPEIASLHERCAYRITFLSRIDHNNQTYLFEGKRYRSQQRGAAWIDCETLMPLRIEYYETNLPRGIESIFYAVDYLPVTLADEIFLLPAAAQAEIKEARTLSRVSCEYQHYQRFATDLKIE